jgi:hypothetical protein
MTGQQIYLQSDIHDKLLEHYAVVAYNGVALMFEKRWAKDKLPVGIGDVDYRRDALRVVLLDTEDNKEYITAMSASWQHDDQYLMDRDYNELPIESTHLQAYFYGSHHCPCHRKDDARRAGAAVKDDECEGNRFRIKEITCAELPGLILYSETIPVHELEESLTRTQGEAVVEPARNE